MDEVTETDFRAGARSSTVDRSNRLYAGVRQQPLGKSLQTLPIVGRSSRTKRRRKSAWQEA